MRYKKGKFETNNVLIDYFEKNKGMTIITFAKRLIKAGIKRGYVPATISSWLLNKSEMKMSNLLEIAEALDFPIEIKNKKRNNYIKL